MYSTQKFLQFWILSSTLIFATVQSSLLAQRDVDPKCNRDLCLRSIIASNINGGPARGSTDCASFFRTTVSPCPVTSVATTVVTARASPVTSTVTLVVATTTVTVSSTAVSTVATTTTAPVESDTITVLTTTTTTSFTSTVTSISIAGPAAPAKRNAGNIALLQLEREAALQKRVTTCTPITSSASSVPLYASACSGTVRYASACSCNGLTRTAVTLAPSTLSSTVTSTVTTTPTSTSTVSSTSIVTVTSITTTTKSTTVILSSTTVTTTTSVSTSVISTATTTTTTVSASVPSTGPYVIALMDTVSKQTVYIAPSLLDGSTVAQPNKVGAARFTISVPTSDGYFSLLGLDGDYLGKNLILFIYLDNFANGVGYFMLGAQDVSDMSNPAKTYQIDSSTLELIPVAMVAQGQYPSNYFVYGVDDVVGGTNPESAYFTPGSGVDGQYGNPYIGYLQQPST